jgi:hypothetical protein
MIVQNGKEGVGLLVTPIGVRVLYSASLLSDLASVAANHAIGSASTATVVGYLLGKKRLLPTLKHWARSAIDEYYDTKAYLSERKTDCEKRIAQARGSLVRDR